MTTNSPKRTALSAAFVILAIVTSAGLAHAIEDEKATYSGTACQPVSATSSIVYGYSYLRNSSTTTAYSVVCPITRHVLFSTVDVGARLWAKRGSETATKLSCALRLHNANGDLLESLPVSSTATGYLNLDFMYSNQYAAWALSPLGNQGETFTIACTLPANSYIFSYETYNMSTIY